MRKFLLAAGIGAISIGTAHAADMEPMPEPFSWTGPYIGLQGGYAWGESDVGGSGGEGGGDAVAAASEPVEIGEEGSIGLDGFVGGLHAGYNWQSDSLLLGLEGDIEYADISGDTTQPFGDIEQDIEWLGSLRLRAGYAHDRALVYVTGGLAVGEVDMDMSDVDFGTSHDKDTPWGWTIGGGVQYAFTDALSGRFEYRYTDLDNTDLDSVTPELGDKIKFENTFHAVRAGLSWHFGAM